jgi:hypothetical protein
MEVHHIVAVNDVGRQFIGSAALPFLKMGVMYDFNQTSGSILLLKLYVKNKESG